MSQCFIINVKLVELGRSMIDIREIAKHDVYVYLYEYLYV